MKQKPKTGNVLVLVALIENGKTKWRWTFEVNGKEEFGTKKFSSSREKAIAHFLKTVALVKQVQIREER